jgi:uncharacterized protein (DUF1778 family)
MLRDNTKRTRPISFNVSPAEGELIERAAASEGLATASYVRRANPGEGQLCISCADAL